MNRPEVRIIQDQQEEIRPADISQNEAEMLLARYGYASQPQSYQQPDQNNGLTFEEMILEILKLSLHDKNTIFKSSLYSSEIIGKEPLYSFLSLLKLIIS